MVISNALRKTRTQLGPSSSLDPFIISSQKVWTKAFSDTENRSKMDPQKSNVAPKQVYLGERKCAGRALGIF